MTCALRVAHNWYNKGTEKKYISYLWGKGDTRKDSVIKGNLS